MHLVLVYTFASLFAASLFAVGFVNSALTPVSTTQCNQFKAILTSTDGGTKTPQQQAIDTNSSSYVAFGSAFNYGICGSLAPSQNTCCSNAAAEVYRFPYLIDTYRQEWEEGFAYLSSSLDFGGPEDFFDDDNGASNDEDAPPIGEFLQRFFDNREQGSTVAQARAILQNDLNDFFSTFFGATFARNYCLLTSSSGCACDAATWATAVLDNFPQVKAIVQSLIDYMKNIAEAFYQIFKAFQALKAVADLAQQYIPGDNCGRIRLAVENCQNCYGLFDLKPCHNLCFGVYQVCFGTFAGLLSPKWKAGVTSLNAAFQNIITYTTNFRPSPNTEFSLCPTCSQLRSMIEDASDVCPDPDFTSVADGFCSKPDCGSDDGGSGDRRRSVDAFNLDIEGTVTRMRNSAASFLQTDRFRAISRRAVGATAESDSGLGLPMEVFHLFDWIGFSACSGSSEFAAPGSTPGTGSGNCWPGSIDIINFEADEAGYKLTLKNMLQQLKAEADDNSALALNQYRNSQQQQNVLNFVEATNPNTTTYIPDQTSAEITTSFANYTALEAQFVALSEASTAASSLVSTSSAAAMFSSLALIFMSAFIALILM